MKRTCEPDDCSTCGRDPRHCFHNGWRVERDGDGHLTIRFACGSLGLAVEEHADGGFRWRVEQLRLGHGRTTRASGRADRLVQAARQLADTVGKAGLGGYLTREEMAVGVLLAERRARSRRDDTGKPTVGE